MKVKYVGLKPRKEDNVAGTGVVWIGHGDVQEVPDLAWAKLSKHPDIWARVDADKPAAPAAPATPPGDQKPADDPPVGAYVLQHADGTTLDLGEMDDKALREFVKTHELQGVDAKKKGDELRAQIVAAIKAAAGQA